MTRISRRKFLKTAATTAAAAGFPTIVPSRIFGQYAPSKQINIGAIGVGRISRGHDMPAILKVDTARIIAVCDLSADRVVQGKQYVNDFYTKKNGKPYDGVTGYANYHELLANKDIDAVVISTPDHQHARVGADAVRAGKDVYLQKPASLTIAEGRYLSDVVQSTGRILQIGSQQRSWKQFHRACELVRNGRIGEVQHVEIGLPGDPAGGDTTPMPVPAGFQYDAWLGSTPAVYYTLDRVMPLKGFDRPGWLRMEQFGAGMITGWGRSPRRHRPLGHEHRVHRPRRNLGHRRVPHSRPMGRPRQVPHSRPLRQRHDHGHLRQLPPTASSGSEPKAGSS